MKSRYSISIPRPCHENWSEMSPNEKGRFCQSCSKIVVDFTNMKTDDIQAFIHNNREQRICGHIKQSQLNTINLQILDRVFEQTLSFHKLFLLALLITMGTSLLTCQDEKGNVKRIESVEIIGKVVDSSIIDIKKSIDSNATCASTEKTDKSITKKKEDIKTVVSPVLDGLIIVTGDIEETLEEPTQVDTIHDIQLEELEGEIGVDYDSLLGMIEVDNLPEFINTPATLSRNEKQNYLNKRMNAFVSKYFNVDVAKGKGFSGTQKVYVNFKIDKKGIIKDIKVRGTDVSIEKEAIRVVKLLPQFIPAKHGNRTEEFNYSLPIILKL